MEKHSVTDEGWVIVHNGYILEWTFKRKRSSVISSWMSVWDPEKTSWRKFKKEGYSCVKATQTTAIKK